MPFENLPYVNFHELNADWMIEQLGNLNQYTESAEQAAEDAAASAATAQQSIADAQGYAEQAAEHATDAANQADRAEHAADDLAEEIADLPFRLLKIRVRDAHACIEHVLDLRLIGYIAVINTDKYGVICQWGTPYGRGIYYQPTNMVITNPLLTQTIQPEIGKICSVIRLQPDWCGVYDLIYQFASLSALAWQAAGVNLINSHLAYVFMAEDKASAESFKKMYDAIASGQPAQFADKKLFDEEGQLKAAMLNQNLKQTYITGDILSDQAKIENMFNTRVGIPNANFEKSERLISDEVNANNSDTQALCSLWLNTMQKGIDQTNRMFNTNIRVKLKFNYEKEGGQDAGNTDDPRII